MTRNKAPKTVDSSRKLTRKERRALRRKRKEQEAEITQVVDPVERSFENILQRQRTESVGEEGYHFVRPKWHAWVYGGAKRNTK